MIGLIGLLVSLLSLITGARAWTTMAQSLLIDVYINLLKSLTCRILVIGPKMKARICAGI